MPVQRVVVSATEPQGKARLSEQSEAPAANGNRRELPAAMKSRLKRIQDWEALAKEASYDPVTMAALCPISLRQLERFFILHFGISPRVWVLELQCRRARELAPAAVGVALIGWKRRWELLFPVVLLATAFAIHLWHRPYWYYYGLHFAIPLAWLGAVGIVEVFRAIWRLDLGASLATKLRAGMGWLGWSLVVSLVLTLAPEKAWNELMRLSAAVPALGDPLVIEFRKRAAATHWVFTDRVIYAFWAGVPVPPELAVIPSKRVWSGQISESEIVQCLERYRPEQILSLSGATDRPRLSDYIGANYQPDTDAGVGGLYLRKR